MKRYFAVLATVLALAGCFHGEKISRVRPGMSIEELQSMMGRQEGYKKIGDYEINDGQVAVLTRLAQDGIVKGEVYGAVHEGVHGKFMESSWSVPMNCLCNELT